MDLLTVSRVVLAVALVIGIAFGMMQLRQYDRASAPGKTRSSSCTRSNGVDEHFMARLSPLPGSPK
jgi:hypothetical protein